MMIQKQIVSASQLVDKVDQLKNKIDNGDFDNVSGLGSILNT